MYHLKYAPVKVLFENASAQREEKPRGKPFDKLLDTATFARSA